MLTLLLGLAVCSAPSATSPVPADTCDVQARYQSLADSATALHRAGDLDASLDLFAQAFAVAPPDRWDAYRAARVASRAGRTGRAFGYLHQAIEAGFDRPGFATLEADLASLRAELDLWRELLDAHARAEAQRYPGTYDEALARQLAAIYVEDQRVRRVLREAGRTHGFPIPDSILAPIETEMSRVDSLVLRETLTILDTHGWPGLREVGNEGATAVFVVIQHAPLAVQERYLSIMEAAVDAGQARAGDFVLLVDRVRVRNGQTQLYGTQYWHDPKTGEVVYHPIEDGIDERLRALGLWTFQEAVEAQGRSWPPRTGSPPEDE